MSVLQVTNLKKRFDELEVLKGISFELEKGEVLAVLGASGSGKTTLLRCLNFLVHADSGSIKVNGEELLCSVANHAELRRKRLHFGLVFQSFNLFPQYTVLQNVTLAPELLARETPEYAADKKAVTEKIKNNALSLLARVGLSDKTDAYPHQLSGGQQQRVAIARALALSPEILCFDEPTSALDPNLTGEVLKVIRSLKSSDRTMIVVTHEMEFARNVADKVIFLDNGLIEEEGTAEEVFASPKSPKTRAFFSSFRY